MYQVAHSTLEGSSHYKQQKNSLVIFIIINCSTIFFPKIALFITIPQSYVDDNTFLDYLYIIPSLMWIFLVFLGIDRMQRHVLCN